MNDYLPISREDLKKRGWDTFDFLYIIGDGYVDHPSFGPAIISRVLEAAGYRVAIIAQPDWHSADDFKKLGKPKLGVLVSAGNIDSMVAHYTAAKKLRSTDAYSPGGMAGKRPDRAVIVYCNRIREAFGNIPIIIGGIEASLRRFAHYDYWDNKVRRSVLFDSKANLLMYGMGERGIVQIADRLNEGYSINDIRDIDGTCYITDNTDGLDAVYIPSYEDVSSDKKQYAIACRMQHEQQDPVRGKILVQKHGDRFLVQNIPQMPLKEKELDRVYALPYMRNYHPVYEKDGGIPGIEEVKFSLTSCRGCFGNCNFCALSFHQGRIVTSRSHDSLIAEAKKIIASPDFKGYIHDVGGPSANFRKPACKNQLKKGACKNRQCLFPKPCPNLEVSHSDYISLLTKLRSLQGVKKVFVRSGLRYDYIMADKSDEFMYQLCKHHISGQLKVAPEHVSKNVLYYMGKPAGSVYNEFSEKYKRINQKIDKKQYLVPYLMSSHPGSTLKDAIELSLYLKKNGLNPQQVQDFYPTPGTISTAMFYTELDPYTLKPVFVAKTFHEKAMQRALLQYKNPANYKLVYDALIQAGREDLIGYTKDCLIRPKTQNKSYKKNTNGGKENGNNSGRKSSISKNKKSVKGPDRSTKGKGNKSVSGSNNSRRRPGK